MPGPIVKALLLSITLVALPMLAQDKSAAPAGIPGCGDPSAKFAVKTSRNHHPVQPEKGKALVYFIQNDSNFNSFPKLTTRVGIDGKWVGATHGNSYLYTAVDPGVHHLCASWQFGVILGKGRKTSAAHFTADAGGVYYFEVKDKYLQGDFGQVLDMTLTPLDSDEGQLLANQYKLSTSHLKK